MIEQLEKVVRKRWLFFFIISNVINLFFFCRYMLLKNYFSISKYECVEHFALAWFSMLFGLAVVGLVYWALFYYPYVKRGTKLLTLQLTLMPFGVAWSLWNGLGEYHWLFSFFSFIQAGLFFYFSLSLLMVNRVHKLMAKSKHEAAEKTMNRLGKLATWKR